MADHVHVYLPQARSNPRPDRPRPIQEWQPQQLGVHPAIHGTNPPDDDHEFVLPSYLERDHDQQLRARLRNAASDKQAVFVLVRGSSCVGKSRTAFEAVRACLPDWQLVFPKNAKGLLNLLNAAALAPRTVLWLNEAQNHLDGPDGEEAAAALHSRMEEPGPLVILGTLWPEYHRDLTATPQPGQHTRGAHPSAHALLDQAVLVDVPPNFTTKVLGTPSVKSDPSLAAAVATSSGGRITQTLAAGPQLVDHYEIPTDPHGPYGRAVITAAMDARRLGHTSPLPAALLEAVAPCYLTDESRATAPDTWFADALAYARQNVRGVAAALEPVANPDGMGALPGVYRLSDYLDHHARITRRYTFPPESFWTAARDHAATTADLMALADAAGLRQRDRISALLYRRAADAGNARALTKLAQMREGAGDFEEAKGLYRRAADAGNTQTLAQMREGAGDFEEAKGLYRRAADAGNTGALTELAELRERVRNIAEADRLYRRAADAGNTQTLTELAVMHERAGDIAEAERLYLQAADAGDTTALTTLAHIREDAGDFEEAERLFWRAADAGDTRALTELAELREQAGDIEGAKGLYRRAADAGNTQALTELAQIREGFGEVEEAEWLYRLTIDAGDTRALMLLARLRRRAGDVEEAQRLYRRAIDAGDTRALPVLAQMREQAGDVEEAQRLYRRAIDAGNTTTALAALAQIREENGDLEGAERILLQAADSGNITALTELAGLRERAGDREEAERLAWQAADSGDTRALPALARMRERAGDIEEAQRLYRLAADAGNTRAMAELAVICVVRGDFEGAERLGRRAADAGDTQALTASAIMCERLGDIEGAERLHRQGVEIGNAWYSDLAVREIRRLRERAGDTEGAERIRRFGLEADGSPAQPW
ncbi:hypothetical protein ACIRYZ_36735 [Kitasatospora sp. NPDC101155]|uniref:SEL1-like repeat protein n=1 Tax=Kitasatospora sp. NPDC101155 TaxID=3364097 RepID=UPI00380446FE